MKLFVILLTLVLSPFAFSAPTPKSDEIDLNDIQAELMNELDTVSLDEEDETFLDQELEKEMKLTAELKKSTPEVKKTSQAPAPTTTKK
jgi:hypothetical protein